MVQCPALTLRQGTAPLLVLLWLGVAVGLAATANAQEPTPAAKPAAQDPAPIAVADILARADTDERFAEGVSRRKAGPDPIDPLAPKLDAVSRSVGEMLATQTPQGLRHLPVMRLESLARHWNFDAQRFAAWEEDMRRASTADAIDSAELARRRAQWEATQAVGHAESVPASFTDRVADVIASLRQAEKDISGPLARQIDLRQRANTVDARIQTGRNAVAAAIADIDARLLRIDSPPLWTARARSSDPDAPASLRAGIAIEARFFREYSSTGSSPQRLFRLLQVLLLPLLLWVSARARRSGVELDTATERVLARPFSAWLLLVVVGVFAFEGDAPLMLHRAAMLIALVPVLRLLPPESRKPLGPWPYVATALYLLEGLEYLFVQGRFGFRVFNLVLSCLALSFTLWVLWRSRENETPLEGTGRTLHVAAGIGAALLLVAVGANVVGNFSLAETLTGGVIDSAYLALMFYAGMNVSIALLRLLRGPLTRIAHKHGPNLVKLLVRLVTLVAVGSWVIYAMDNFRILRPTYAVVGAALSRELKLGEISITLGHVLIFVLSSIIVFWMARGVRILLHEEVLPRMSLPRGVGNSVASLSYYVLLLAGLLLALSAAGFKVGELTLVFGALGVGVGFGLQGVVNNFVSGLILMFERPIQPGDVIEIGGMSGRVGKIGMRATTIRTFEGADVVVPNGALLSENLTNWTLLDSSRRLDVSVGVGYGSDPARVSELLKETARQTPGVASQPGPEVYFMEFGASSLDFVVRAWTYEFDSWVRIRSDLVTRVHAALVEAGISIPFPQHDLHLRSVSEAVYSLLDAGPDPKERRGGPGSEPRSSHPSA